MHFLKSFKDPEGEIDLDAEWVEDRAVEIFGQSSACLSWMFSEPAHINLLQELSADFASRNFKVFAGYKECQNCFSKNAISAKSS